MEEFMHQAHSRADTADALITLKTGRYSEKTGAGLTRQRPLQIYAWMPTVFPPSLLESMLSFFIRKK
jgi:hypothetical protein